MAPRNSEFEIIERFFKRQADERGDVFLGIGDDCALLVPPANDQTLAVTTDTLVQDTHFTAFTPASSIGHKALAVSLSDLAAMGAEPAWVLLSLTLPEINEQWLDAFCSGFFTLMRQHAMQLVGGNLTRGPLSITTQVFGFVPKHLAIRRDSAQPGDLIYTTGYLGEAGLGLKLCQDNHKYTGKETFKEALINRLNSPEPRIKAGLALRGIATAAIDISDGLIADLGHILEKSQVGASIYLEKLAISEAIKSMVTTEQAYESILSAGDDYELCFTISPEKEMALKKILPELECVCTCIGQIESAFGLRIYDKNGKTINVKRTGYSHF